MMVFLPKVPKSENARPGLVSKGGGGWRGGGESGKSCDLLHPWLGEDHSERVTSQKAQMCHKSLTSCFNIMLMGSF